LAGLRVIFVGEDRGENLREKEAGGVRR